MKRNRVQKFAKNGHEKEVVSKNSQKVDMKKKSCPKIRKKWT